LEKHNLFEIILKLRQLRFDFFVEKNRYCEFGVYFGAGEVFVSIGYVVSTWHFKFNLCDLEQERTWYQNQ
jgi:hypothetical protein